MNAYSQNCLAMLKKKGYRISLIYPCIPGGEDGGGILETWLFVARNCKGYPVFVMDSDYDREPMYAEVWKTIFENHMQASGCVSGKDNSNQVYKNEKQKILAEINDGLKTGRLFQI